MTQIVPFMTAIETALLVNHAGGAAILPVTGGIGTKIFKIGGLVLMVAAVALFILRARAKDDEEEEKQP